MNGCGTSFLHLKLVEKKCHFDIRESLRGKCTQSSHLLLLMEEAISRGSKTRSQSLHLELVVRTCIQNSQVLSQYGDGGNRGIGGYIPVDYTGVTPEDGFLLFNRYNGGDQTTHLCINPKEENVCFLYTGDGTYGGSDHTYLVPIKKGSEWVFSGDLSPIDERLWFISFKNGVKIKN